MHELTLLDRVKEWIRVQHDSLRTEEASVSWSTRYILFHQKTQPRLLTPQDINQFLTLLATERHRAASTLHQAKRALLFLSREVWDQAIDWMDEVVSCGCVNAWMGECGPAPSSLIIDHGPWGPIPLFPGARVKGDGAELAHGQSRYRPFYQIKDFTSDESEPRFETVEISDFGNVSLSGQPTDNCQRYTIVVLCRFHHSEHLPNTYHRGNYPDTAGGSGERRAIRSPDSTLRLYARHFALCALRFTRLSFASHPRDSSVKKAAVSL